MRAAWRRWRKIAGWLGAIAAVAPMAAAAATPPAKTPGWETVRADTFQLVWDTVNEAYYDPTFGGVDWAAIREKYRPRLVKAGDKAALRELLQQMLGELHRTHFSILPREAAVFTPEERNRIGTVGLRLGYAEGKVVVAAVQPDSPAAGAGVVPGTVLLGAADLDLVRIGAALLAAHVPAPRCGLYLINWTNSRLHSPVGSKIALSLANPDGSARPLTLVSAEYPGVWSEPVGNFPSQPIESEVRPLGEGVTYLRFNVFAREAFRVAKQTLLTVPPNGGLVIDLRGNPGGVIVMASGLCGWLCGRECMLGTMHLRQGRLNFAVFPQPRAFLGPVAVLIDGGTASTSEILAAGLQELGRARVFGEPSAGAALPAVFKTLPTGDLFQYAIADVLTPRGQLIEGHGVQPDQPVARALGDIAAGRDPVLAAAVSWVNQQRTAPEGTPAPVAAKP
ncbi:MAG: S41 family peptidase [Opitutales bacterium]